MGALGPKLSGLLQAWTGFVQPVSRGDAGLPLFSFLFCLTAVGNAYAADNIKCKLEICLRSHLFKEKLLLVGTTASIEDLRFDPAPNSVLDVIDASSFGSLRTGTIPAQVLFQELEALAAEQELSLLDWLPSGEDVCVCRTELTSVSSIATRDEILAALEPKARPAYEHRKLPAYYFVCVVAVCESEEQLGVDVSKHRYRLQYFPVIWDCGEAGDICRIVVPPSRDAMDRAIEVVVKRYMRRELLTPCHGAMCKVIDRYDQEAAKERRKKRGRK